jgi:hypothetical protein
MLFSALANEAYNDETTANDEEKLAFFYFLFQPHPTKTHSSSSRAIEIHVKKKTNDAHVFR